MKSVSYQRFPRDFAADEHVMMMSVEAEYAYNRLLDHQCLHGSIPDDIPQLSKIISKLKPREIRKILPEILPCFVQDDEPGRLYNRRMRRGLIEREDYLSRQRENGKKGANVRYGTATSTANGAAIAPPLAPPSVSLQRRHGPQSQSLGSSLASEESSLFEQYGAILRDLYPKRFATDDIVTHRALQEMANTLPPPAEFRAALEEWVNSEEWKKKGGQFIKSPANFIREEKWKSHPASSGSTTNGDHIADKLKTKVYVTRRQYENEIAKTLPKGDERIYGVREALERAETMAQLDEVRTAWLPAS